MLFMKDREIIVGFLLLTNQNKPPKKLRKGGTVK
jgi:hypothetical protein